jgi:predicted Na+-dependent transporter
VIAILQGAARHGRFILVLGLLAGVLLPELAAAMKPWLPELVSALLFLAALRVGPRQVVGSLADMKASLFLVLVFQIVMPLAMFAIAGWAGLGPVPTTAMVLMAAAAPLLGASNLTILTGNDPASALRLLVAGLALLPLTIVPTLAVIPEIGGVEAIAAASMRLLALVVSVVGLAFAVRHFVFGELTDRGVQALDGFSAIAMAIVVIGLMAAIGPAIRSEPDQVLKIFGLAVACNFGLQLATYTLAGLAGADRNRVAYAIVAGNRNMAFFLAALPASVMEPLFLFIGCYQVPMYLTPLILGGLYRRSPAQHAGSDPGA